VDVEIYPDVLAAVVVPLACQLQILPELYSIILLSVLLIVHAFQCIRTNPQLAVSIDYLVGKTNLVLDQDTLKRLEDINALPGEAKDYILNHIDIMIRDFKNKKTYSHK